MPDMNSNNYIYIWYIYIEKVFWCLFDVTITLIWSVSLLRLAINHYFYYMLLYYYNIINRKLIIIDMSIMIIPVQSMIVIHWRRLASVSEGITGRRGALPVSRGRESHRSFGVRMIGKQHTFDGWEHHVNFVPCYLMGITGR